MGKILLRMIMIVEMVIKWSLDLEYILALNRYLCLGLNINIYLNFYTYNGKEQVGVDAGEGYTLSGDIKATQGDTGHAQADMVTDLYSHILDEDRKVNAQKFDESFYQNNDEDNAKRKKDSIDVDKLVASLKDNPDLLDKLLDALK